MEKIEKLNFDEERALYNISNTLVIDCSFIGKNDGESVLKETRDCVIENCKFGLRYPLWHAKKYKLSNSTMDENTRAPIWYSNNGTIDNSKILGVKCLRECVNTIISNSTIHSIEFGWKCKNLMISSSTIDSEYFLFNSKNTEIENLRLKGKYSFQYMNNVKITNSFLDTKDAFWHSKNILVKDSTIKGEYLGWFSENLTLINCTIIGTQPLCYCKNLKLINCKMQNTDLAFEYSSVKAKVFGHIDSIKNPKSGFIICDSVGEIIKEQSIMKCNAKIILREKND